ncbi:MAG: GNAT family N-acetyltransferase [Promethearchaeota archaeon]
MEKITIRPLNATDYVDISTCCHEIVELISSLEEDIEKEKVTGLVASVDNICVGAIIAELDVESTFSDMQPFPLPCVRLLFIEVNKKFRDKGIGKRLLSDFKEMMRKKGISLIYIRLYKNYRNGARFFERAGFQKEKVERNQIIYKLNLWSDFGVVEDNDIED